MPSLPRNAPDAPPTSAPIVDQGVPESNDAAVPRWLLFSYGFLPVFGLVMLYYFWDGSFGWFDRGAWSALQQAANTR